MKVAAENDKHILIYVNEAIYLKAEQDSADRRSEGNRYTCCRSGRQYLPFSSCIKLDPYLSNGACRIPPSFVLRIGKALIKRFAQQHATCTSGPSLPSHKPDATATHY
jgi:hypothetical protein